MSVLGPQAIGTDASYPLTLLGSDGQTAANLAGVSGLSATIWAGDDQPPLATEAVAVTLASAGLVLLKVAAADTLTIGSAGTYSVRVAYTTPDGHTLEGWRGNLQLVASPGSAAAPAVYCSRADMAEVAAWIDRMQDLAQDQAGFAAQRAQARQMVDEAVLSRARAVLDDQGRRHAPVLGLPPFVPTTGVDSGPWWGPSLYPDLDAQAQLDALAATLAAGTLAAQTLAVDARLRRVAALLAVSIVCRQQLGEAAADTSYQMLARTYRSMAMAQLYGCEFRVSLTPGSGLADMVIR